MLDELQASLPGGMIIHRNIFRQAEFIESAIHNLTLSAARNGVTNENPSTLVGVRCVLPMAAE